MAHFETVAVHGDLERVKHRPSVDFCTLGDEINAIENSSKQRLEERIALLEKGKHALCFSSGLAAVTSISMLLKNGDHVIIFDSVYHGTRTYLNIREALKQVEVDFVDLRDASCLEKHLKPNTKMVWTETPCNPTMKIVDIAAVSKIIKTHGKAILVVDNTFMSSYFQNPLLFGADVVMHSLTKYMNGHSDVLMGVAVTNNDQLFQKIKESSQIIGSLPSPVDCYLALRGLKTLHLRMERHMLNAMTVAQFLENHRNVEVVFYPGLKSHPQHEIALKQCKGFSGMVSFRLKGGHKEIRFFASRLKIFTLAVSLGCAESLVDIPSLMTASALNKEERELLEITDNLVRLSVGLEDARDLTKDLDQALDYTLEE